MAVARSWGGPAGRRTRPVGVFALTGLTALAALALSGCGGSGPAATGSPAAGSSSGSSSSSSGGGATLGDQGYAATEFTKQPCELLSPAEVGQAVGGTVTATPSTSATGLKVCEWTRPGNSSGLADLQLHYNAAPLAKAFKVGLQQNLVASDEQRVDIGDGAVLKTGQGDVYVLVGNSEFEVNGSSSKPVSDTAVLSLAKLAASRLP
jgi:uncharacterized protein DUF3558